MANKQFIFQGFTERTHAAAVRDLFDVEEVRGVSISVAFVNEGGVEHIEDLMRPHTTVTRVFSGIRNEITSFQGLIRLYGLIGAGLHTVDTGSRLTVFHPKFFLVRGEHRARLIIGSANLTLGGLNNNIEASLFLDCDLGDAADRTLVDEVEARLAAMSAEYAEHIVPVTSEGILNEMLQSGRLIDERALPPPRPRTSTGSGGASDTITRIKLKVPRIRRPMAKAAAPAKKEAAVKTTQAKVTATSPAVAVPASTGVDFELVWESKPLTRRDLGIPTGETTNVTGSINLDKGLLPAEVDQRHYFRDEIFPALTWATRSATVDEAYGRFQLVLKGISHGNFDIAIRHTTSTDTKSYTQSNAMTRLSWGPMREHVAREDLIGRTLALYRDVADPKLFVLEID